MKTDQINVTPRDIQDVTFNLHDAKGRQIGTQIVTWEADYIPTPDAESWYPHEPGHFFLFEPHATRDGHRYGASQPRQSFATVANREAAIAKYIVGFRKRAQKLATAQR